MEIGVLSWRERRRMEEEKRLLSNLSRQQNNKSSGANLSFVIAVLVLMVSMLSLYYSQFYVHRDISIVVGTNPRVIESGMVVADSVRLSLKPVISNAGTETEVVLSL